LEGRSLPSTCTWIGGGYDSFSPLHQPQGSDPEAWSNPLNWLERVVPGPGDTAVFPADFVIAFDGDQPVIAPFDRAAVVDVPTTIAGFSILSNTASNRGVDTIALAQNLTLTGTSEWDLGAINASPGTLTNNGTLTMDPIEGLSGAHIIFGFGSTVVNNGTIIQQGTAALAMRGSFTNAAGGVYDLQAEGNNVIGNDGQFLNLGTLMKSAGTGVSSFQVSYTDNGGLIDVESGTLRPANATDNGTTFRVAPGATLDWGASGQGNATITGTITGTGTDAGQGTVLLSTSGHISVGSGGATLNFPAGLFQWTGGGISLGANNLTNLAGSLITIVGDAGKGEDGFGGGVLTNAGTITQQGDGRFALRGNLTNQGLYDLQTDAGFGGDNTFVNHGTFQKSSGPATAAIDTFFSNPGMVLALSGTLVFDFETTEVSSNTLTGGTWGVDNGARLTLDSGVPLFTNSGTIVLDGPGSTFTNIANLNTNNGSLSLLDGQTFTTAGDFTNTGTLTLGVASTLTLSGNFTQTSASTLDVRLGDVPANGQFGQLVVTGQANLDGTLQIDLVNGYAPNPGDAFTILTLATRNADFANLNIAGGGVWDPNAGTVTF
jgi:hypothetical protein